MYLALLMKEVNWKDNSAQPSFFVSSLFTIPYAVLFDYKSSFSGFFRVLFFDSSVFIY